MSPTLERIRQQLVTQTAERCEAHPYVYAPDKITQTPCVFVGSIKRTPASMGGAVDLECKLYLFVKAGGDGHMADLDRAVHGDGSITEAIDEDPTLGLDDVLVTVDEVGDYALHEWAGQPFWGVSADVTVMVD